MRNMLTHGQKGLQFLYNFINLPKTVTGPNGTTVYSFSADGIKVGVERNGYWKYSRTYVKFTNQRV